MSQVFAPQSGPLPSGRVVILRSLYHEQITSRLLQGALAVLSELNHPRAHTEILEVPGAFELTAAAARVARNPDVDAVIALGCVVRGETPHFDYICQAVANGLARVAEESGKPVSFGVITANTVEQAFERAGGRAGNKGAEAARAVLQLYSVLKQWEQHPARG